MMSAFFSAVSGLKSQTTGLNVIANNISNVNTTGYKSQRVTFSDVLSQTLSGASGATDNTGGTNPQQVGLGVSVASTDTNMTAGSTQSTGVATDVAISGSGFFVVSAGSAGDYLYTRQGSTSVDEEGNLTVNGNKICGWLQYTKDADGNYVYNTDADLEAINIYSDSYNGNKKIMAAAATTEADYSGNLKTSATASGSALNIIGTVSSFDQTADVTVYDSQGNDYSVTVSWKKCYVDSTTDPANPVTSWYYEISSDDLTVSPSSGYVQFDASGNIITGVTGYDTSPAVTLTPNATTGAAAFSVAMDFADIVQKTTSTTADITGSVDGYPAGTLSGISIESTGIITGTYSNGETQPLGMIALATFTNPEGLEKSGDNLYSASSNSGVISYVSAGSGGTSSLSTGCLEMSNVDLAEQFSQMMISQRAYQANSKVVSTADEMLQSLINMAG